MRRYYKHDVSITCKFHIYRTYMSSRQRFYKIVSYENFSQRVKKLYSVKWQIQPSTIKVWVLLLIRLLHPHTQRRRHQRFFMDNSESINMKQTNRTETFETLVNYNKGICPDINSLLNMKTVLQVTSVPIRSLFVFSIQLLPVFTCCLQSVLQGFLVYSHFIATIFPRWLKGADTHFIFIDTYGAWL